MSTESQKPCLRLLALTNRAMEVDDINEWVTEVKVKVATTLDVDTTLVNSRDWHEQEFARCGGWDSWAWETVNGKDFSTRKPFFDGFVVGQTVLGRANAQIIHLALGQAKVVLFCESGKPLGIVTELLTVDSERWVDGWTITVDAIGDM